MFNAYVIAFGGLLLLGGRLSDLVGAKRIFALGWAVLAAGSLAAGLADSAGVEVAARAVQGAGADGVDIRKPPGHVEREVDAAPGASGNEALSGDPNQALRCAAMLLDQLADERVQQRHSSVQGWYEILAGDLAMQKVEGSSPFSRFRKGPQKRTFSARAPSRNRRVPKPCPERRRLS